jgi:hypothetical protein
MKLKIKEGKGRTSVTPVRQAGEGLELADLLRKKWRNVNYDSKTGRGNAELGQIRVEWTDSQNDPAIWITIQQKARVKSSSPASVQKVLEQINTLLGKLG